MIFYRWLTLSFSLLLLFSPGAVSAKNSTGEIIAYKQVLEISTHLQLPSDVAVDGKGYIYVLDGTVNLVRVYDKKGIPLFTLGGDKMLSQPLGIDVSPAGDVLVADSGNHRLAYFALGQTTPQYLDLPSPPDGKPADPTDVCFAVDNRTFLAVDNDNHRILALDHSGAILWSRGGMGRNPGEFRFPFMMDQDEAGNIYVVEVINTRVQVLDAKGNFSQFIGEWGIEPGQLYRPKGVAVNDSNEVFVSDSYLGVIQIFDREGRLTGIVGDENGKLRKFSTPVGMTSSDSRLFVVEMFKNRITVLQRQKSEN
jgi:DNA-binding beta-propeller fold protein YncE